MLRTFKILAVMALGALALSACGGKDNETTETVSVLDYMYPNGRITRDITVQSAALSRKMNYSVWMPKDYDESQSYPVLYLLHGYGDDNNSWLDKGDLATIATRYTLTGTPMIIVCPDGLTMFYSGSWETYFYDELIPAVEKKFSCNGKKALAGLSMGGYGTIYHALAHPADFTYAYAMSPAVLGDMTSMVTEQGDVSVFPAFTFEVGLQDSVVNNSTTQTLYEALVAAGVECEWIERAGYHSWDFWQACLPKALEKVGESFK